MARVDGKHIRDDIQKTLVGEFFKRENLPVLSIIYIGSSSVIEKFIALKKRFGASLGIDVRVHTFDFFDKESIQEVIASSGFVVVQLPVPDDIDMEEVVNMVPKEKDIDMLSAEAFKAFLAGTTKRMPPVVGAVAEIFQRHNIDLVNKKIVLIGKGKLVGKPLYLWFVRQGITPTILGEGDNLAEYTADADIIISGAGSPHIISPDMVKEGVVLVDVGTSSDRGVLKGDIDPVCEEKAVLYSGVPGGLGPITIAKLFQNMNLQ